MLSLLACSSLYSLLTPHSLPCSALAVAVCFASLPPLRAQMQPGFMYEHTYELLLHSAGYSSSEWSRATPWNKPSSATLAPGESRTYGFRMLLSPSLRGVEGTLLSAGHPVARILPGPVLNADMESAALWLSLPKGYGEVPRISAEPADALVVEPCVRSPGGGSGGGGTAGEREREGEGGAEGAVHLRCALRRLRAPPDGRVRLTIDLTAGGAAAAARHPSADAPATSPPPPSSPLRLTAHVFIAAPARDLITAYGAHGASSGWLPTVPAGGGAPDPWHRDGAFFGWDAERNQSVVQERRVYMSGLSDEAGASAPLAMSVKQLGAPDASEVAKLEEFIHETVWQARHTHTKHHLHAHAYRFQVRFYVQA